MNARVTSYVYLTILTSVAAQPAEKPVVSIVMPAPATAAATYELPGRTEPIEQATVFTRATGIVKERRYDIGDRVKAGDVLAVIDVPEIDRAVESAKAQVDQAASRAKNARMIGERADDLLKTRAISKEDSEFRITTAETADAALRVAEAELNRVQELRKFATVTAPFNGTIAARNFDRGDRMRGDSSTADGWLYKLARLESLRFVISATPDLALRLSKDSEAVVRFNELPGKTFTAKLDRSSGVFDTASGTMRVEYVIDNKDLLLPAGLPGTAALKLPPVENTFTLPNNTLVVRQGKPLVATANEGKVAFIDVLPGRNLGPVMEMTSARLTPQSQVIVNPNAMLKEGDAVDAKPVPPAAK
jgi:membrane fusion protein (multidrug efflux system)